MGIGHPYNNSSRRLYKFVKIIFYINRIARFKLNLLLSLNYKITKN